MQIKGTNVRMQVSGKDSCGQGIKISEKEVQIPEDNIQHKIQEQFCSSSRDGGGTGLCLRSRALA